MDADKNRTDSAQVIAHMAGWSVEDVLRGYEPFENASLAQAWATRLSQAIEDRIGTPTTYLAFEYDPNKKLYCYVTQQTLSEIDHLGYVMASCHVVGIAWHVVRGPKEIKLFGEFYGQQFAVKSVPAGYQVVIG